MKRRNFLQTLLGLTGTTALPVNSNIRGQQQIEALKLLEIREPLINHSKLKAKITQQYP